MSAAGQIRLTRRHAILGLAAGGALLLVQRSAAIAAGASADAAIASFLNGRKAVPSDRLSLNVPLSSESGMSVALGITVDSPMTPEEHVRRVDVFTDGNPIPEVASLLFSPGSPARASTRFRLDKGDHLIWAVAELSDGSLITASAKATTASDGCSGKSGMEVPTTRPEPIPRVNVPDRAGKGEIVDVHSMIAHRMETGFRTDNSGNPLPRHIINRMECSYAGRIVFSAELTPAIAANAYMRFPIRAVETGEVAFAWYEDGGAVYRATRRIAVE